MIEILEDLKVLALYVKKESEARTGALETVEKIKNHLETQYNAWFSTCPFVLVDNTHQRITFLVNDFILKNIYAGHGECFLSLSLENIKNLIAELEKGNVKDATNSQS